MDILIPKLGRWTPPRDHGRFILSETKTGKIIAELNNQFTDEGREAFLKMIFRADVTDVASGGNFYIGLCGATVAATTTLATVSGEPSVTNGYARKPVTRAATGFPTISTVNGVWRAQSLGVVFTASGGAFSTSFSRIFLCSVVSGTAGKLFSFGGALTSAISVPDGTSYTVQYEFYAD